MKKKPKEEKPKEEKPQEEQQKEVKKKKKKGKKQQPKEEDLPPPNDHPIGFQTMIIGPGHRTFPPAEQYEMARDTLNSKIRLNADSYDRLPVINKTIHKMVKVEDCQIGFPRSTTIPKGREKRNKYKTMLDSFNANRGVHNRLVYSSFGNNQPSGAEPRARLSGCKSTPPTSTPHQPTTTPHQPLHHSKVHFPRVVNGQQPSPRRSGKRATRSLYKSMCEDVRKIGVELLRFATVSARGR